MTLKTQTLAAGSENSLAAAAELIKGALPVRCFFPCECADAVRIGVDDRTITGNEEVDITVEGVVSKIVSRGSHAIVEIPLIRSIVDAHSARLHNRRDNEIDPQTIVADKGARFWISTAFAASAIAIMASMRTR